MTDVVDKLKDLSTSHMGKWEGSGFIQRPNSTGPKPIPEFTWIHLPATNMVWMDHLLQRIMKDERQHVGHFNQAKSFFRDSWIEVPDKLSVARMMRPRFVTRDKKETGIQGRDENTGPERNSDSETISMDGGDRENAKKEERADLKDTFEQMGLQHEEPTVTAIYMPYLSYAFQYGGGINNKENDEANPMSFQTEEQLEDRLATTEELTTHCTAGDVIGLETKKEHKHEYDEGSNYAKRLMKTQDTYQVLLDEYKGKIIHGSSTLDESYYHFGDDPGSIEDRMRRNKTQVVTEIWRKKRLGSYWLLIRVNQLWIWTINNRWLISASSHPIDDGENELLNDVLDRLEKDREAGGSILQQASTAEMSQLIVDFCVDSYEQKPKELAEATSRADDLSCRVKDILDELSILESTVQCQQDVQKAMRKKGTKKENEKRETAEMDLTATYVINDIKRLNSVAERVLAAVNTTLSLHQSEVANLQAKLSVEHAEPATKQGRVLMVFTVVTILFLPMSFLTSLFALDVASFEQALIVIFSVSIGFFIPAVLFAFVWDQSKQVTSKLLGPAIKVVMAFICCLLESAEASKRIQQND
ncbi:1-alkyl-2-acetylglycerophosphocholine esterase, partial [Colletotrichum asianum]